MLNLNIPQRAFFSCSFACPNRPIAVDGVLGEWDEACRLPSLMGLEGRREFAQVQVAWNDSGLFLGLQVKGKTGYKLDPKNFWLGDCLEVWVDTRDLAITAPVDASTRLSIEALMARVSAAEPSLTPTTLAVRARATMPVALAAGPRMLYVDPYSGAIVGEGSTKVRAFFRSVTDWHRYLAASGESRPTGRAVTGAANLAFLFIVISGICMWWPRSWNWNQIRTESYRESRRANELTQATAAWA